MTLPSTGSYRLVVLEGLPTDIDAHAVRHRPRAEVLVNRRGTERRSRRSTRPAARRARSTATGVVRRRRPRAPAGDAAGRRDRLPPTAAGGSIEPSGIVARSEGDARRRRDRDRRRRRGRRARVVGGAALSSPRSRTGSADGDGKRVARARADRRDHRGRAALPRSVRGAAHRAVVSRARSARRLDRHRATRRRESYDARSSRCAPPSFAVRRSSRSAARRLLEPRRRCVARAHSARPGSSSALGGRAEPRSAPAHRSEWPTGAGSSVVRAGDS